MGPLEAGTQVQLGRSVHRSAGGCKYPLVGAVQERVAALPTVYTWCTVLAWELSLERGAGSARNTPTPARAPSLIVPRATWADLG